MTPAVSAEGIATQVPASATACSLHVLPNPDTRVAGSLPDLARFPRWLTVGRQRGKCRTGSEPLTSTISR
jgi:hypothetical protein